MAHLFEKPGEVSLDRPISRSCSLGSLDSARAWANALLQCENKDKRHRGHGEAMEVLAWPGWRALELREGRLVREGGRVSARFSAQSRSTLDRDAKKANTHH